MDQAENAALCVNDNSGWWEKLWSGGFMPHGCCYNWRPEIYWPHVISDLLIAAAYYSIPMILFAFVRKRRDVPFNAIFVIFGIFILACGTTHVLEVVTVWEPMYRLAAVVKMITAAVSVTAVCMLIPVMPKALALPSLQAANKQLQRTANDLKRSNEELEQFSYVASHDLQEPLRMVSMHLDLIKRSKMPQLDDQGREYLALAADGAERMRKVMASLISFARLDHIDPPADAVDANQCLADALKNLQAVIASSQAQVSSHGELPRVRMDASQLIQVFQNIISNAIKFRRSGTVRPFVRITAKTEADQVVFSVQDNGIGIDAAHFERIFIVFQRVHDRDAYEGSGIGLASVKKIVERHGGRVWLESEPGTGTTFHFSIPAPFNTGKRQP